MIILKQVGIAKIPIETSPKHLNINTTKYKNTKNTITQYTNIVNNDNNGTSLKLFVSYSQDILKF